MALRRDLCYPGFNLLALAACLNDVRDGDTVLGRNDPGDCMRRGDAFADANLLGVGYRDDAADGGGVRICD